MDAKYTPGPWKIWSHPKGFRVGESENKPVAEIFPTLFVEKEEANARRIAACWNACEGISTEDLTDIARTGGMLGPRDDIAQIAKQRDGLANALSELLNEIDGLMGESAGVYGLHLNGDPSPWSEIEEGGRFERLPSMSKARAVLAKVTGEQS